MRKEEQFNNILNECLDRILKGETVEQCLKSYPELAKELEPLLKTARAARVMSSVQPRPEFKAEARRQFQAALIERKVRQNERKASKGRRLQWRWQSGWAIALITAVVVVLGGGSTVAAASGSMPDDNLYSVKLAAEKVQLALSTGEVIKAKLNAKFADRRTEEIIYMAEKGNAQEAQIAATRLNSNLSNITNLAAADNQKNSTATEQPKLMAPKAAPQSENAPQPMFGVAPAPDGQAAPGIKNAAGRGDDTSVATTTPAAPEATEDTNVAMSVQESVAVQSTQITISEATPVVVEDIDNTSTAATENSRLIKYQKLRQIIQQNYEKRKQKLEEAIKNASPSVRPVLRQALVQSEWEYEKALRELEQAEQTENARNSDNSSNSQDNDNLRDRRSNRN